MQLVIVWLSDENGEVVAHYEYSPFGSLTKVSGDYAANNPFRFSSEYFDEETGLVYYNYRYYNPELGRWISRDPIEEQGGYNLYGMLANNTLYFWDMLGTEPHYVDHSCIDLTNPLSPFSLYNAPKHNPSPLKKSQTIADAVNRFYPDMKATAIEHSGFAKVSDSFRRPSNATNKPSLHSGNAYELSIPGEKDYVIKVYPDDENKVAITRKTDSFGHYVEAVYYKLTGGQSFNYQHAKTILEKTEQK